MQRAAQCLSQSPWSFPPFRRPLFDRPFARKKSVTTNGGWRDQDAHACSELGIRALLAIASHQPSRLRARPGHARKQNRIRFCEFAPYSLSSIQADSRQENENAKPRAALAASGTTAWLDRSPASENRPW